MKPLNVLSTDFRDEEIFKRQEVIDTTRHEIYKTFITPAGKNTLDMLKDMVSGPMVVGSVHESIANAARREVVDMLVDTFEQVKEELSK